MTDLQYLSIIVVVTFFGNITTAIVAAVLNAYYVKQAKEEAVRAAAIAESTRQVSLSTHKIVNNQRTQMLRLVANLSARIAKENPGDKEAQIVASQTEVDALHASDAERV